MRARSLFCFSLVGLSFGCSTAFAHSRWFLADEHLPSAPPLVFDAFFAAMIAAIVLFVASGSVLTRLGSSHRAIARFMDNEIRLPAHLAWRVLSFSLGMTLVINSLVRVFVAPDQLLDDGLPSQFIAFFQAIVGSMFVLQSRLLLASVLAALLPVLCWSFFSFGHAIDYAFELIGIAAALFLMAPSLSSVDRDLWVKIMQHLPFGGHRSQADPALAERRKHRAVAIMRVMFGLQLIVLAAHDKLLYPETSLAFLDKFSFVNFPALLGLSSFTNLHFVIGAGLAEFAFGAMLIGNVATRPVCIILTAIFVLTGCIFGGEELIGHVPIVAAILVLLVSGTSRRQPAVASKRTDAYMFRMAVVGCAAMVLGAFLLNSPERQVNSAQSESSTQSQS